MTVSNERWRRNYLQNTLKKQNNASNCSIPSSFSRSGVCLPMLAFVIATEEKCFSRPTARKIETNRCLVMIILNLFIQNSSPPFCFWLFAFPGNQILSQQCQNVSLRLQKLKLEKSFARQEMIRDLLQLFSRLNFHSIWRSKFLSHSYFLDKY